MYLHERLHFITMFRPESFVQKKNQQQITIAKIFLNNVTSGLILEG